MGTSLDPTPLTTDQLLLGLDHIRASPPDVGTVDLVIRRPAVDAREVLEVAELDPEFGVVGDSWNQRWSKRTDDGSPHPDMQLNVMNSRVAALVAQHADRWALAGDQLYVDLDLSVDNIPPGTRFALGSAVIEFTDQPHNGCAKFTQRFGLDAHRFVNDPEHGKPFRLRGANAKVVHAGTVRPGDTITKLP